MRLHIVAVKDSGVLTLCPAKVVEPTGKPLFTTPAEGSVVAIRMQRDGDATLSVRVWDTGEQATLPLPRDKRSSPGGSPAPVQLDQGLLTWDDEIASAVVEHVRKEGRFVLSSLDEAEYVLLIEAQHRPFALFRGQRGPMGGGIGVAGGDREANFREAVLAMVVRAGQYRKHGPSATHLLPAAVWTGAALARQSQAAPASVESLVDQLTGKAARPPGFPPVCAASSSRADSLHDDALPLMQGLRPDVFAVTTEKRPAASFRGGITYVTVPVVVTDASGRAVSGLSAGDFGIYENDAKQTLERLADGSAPVTLALVVDTSESMRSEVSHLRNALLRFLATLGSENHLMLATFDERVQVHVEADAGRDRIRLALWRMDRRAGTRLYDAVALVGKRAQTLGDRKGIVLLTDGVDTRSRLADAESTLEAAGQSHVPVYVIQYDTARNDYALPSGVRSGGMDVRDMSPVVLPEGALDNRALFERARAYLAALTDMSGGRLYRADSQPNLNQAFAQVVRDLGDQYTLGYYPTNQARDGTYRKLRVEVRRPGVVVKARAGYQAAAKENPTRTPGR